MSPAPELQPTDILNFYLNLNFRLVMWPAREDHKGPREQGWLNRSYGLKDYDDTKRVGILLGTEISEGKFLVDVDIDWGAGNFIAQALIPSTGFVFGRSSKPVSHCFYTVPEAPVTVKYEDPIDKTTLIELRGVKQNGDIGFQTMVPPSVWTKSGQSEALSFRTLQPPTHLNSTTDLRQKVCLGAIAMLLAKHLGYNGFGHEPRLAFAGFFLRANLQPEDIIRMGEAMSRFCNNTEVEDVRRVVETTARALENPNSKKAKGGPTLAKILGRNGRALLETVNKWLGRESDFVRDSKGLILAKNQDNIRRALQMLGHELTFNEFAGKLLVDGEQMEKKAVNALYLEIEREYRFSPPREYFEMVVEDMAWTNSFHPVREYLERLIWDGISRIDDWLVLCAQADDTPYVRAVSSIMLVAAVRRVRHPGCKYDEMVVWESSQGANKSSAAAALCPKREWFSDDLPLSVDSKELIERTLGKWIIEASDLAGKRKTEIEQLKAMMSRSVDGPARLAYEHYAIERQRHFIMVGTTNSPVYLTDPTGNRRFWPINVRRFDVDWIVAMRDQLWAEACVRESEGMSIRLPEDLWGEAAEKQEARSEMDPWEETITALLEQAETVTDSNRYPDVRFNGKRVEVITEAIWKKLGVDAAYQDRRGSLRISEIMHKLGYRRQPLRSASGKQMAGYVEEPESAARRGGSSGPGPKNVVDPLF